MKSVSLILIAAITVAFAATVCIYVPGSLDDEDDIIRFFDDGNIMVQMVNPHFENGHLLFTFFEKGNYSIFVSCVSYTFVMSSRTLNFSICSVPYQYKFERFELKDYELVILDKS